MIKWDNYLISNTIEQGTLMEYQQKRVFHVFLILMVLCIPAYTCMISFPNKLYYYFNGALFILAALFTTAYFTKKNEAEHRFLFYSDFNTCRNRHRDYLLFHDRRIPLSKIADYG